MRISANKLFGGAVAGCLAVGLLTVGLGYAPPAKRQIRLRQADPKEPAQVEDYDAAVDLPAPVPPAHKLSAQFQRLLLGQVGEVSEIIRDLDEDRLRTKLTDLEYGVRISPAVQRKLMLAGQGDMKRLADRVTTEEKRFEAIDAGAARPEQMKSLIEAVSLLRPVVEEDLFRDGSLFDKVLRKELTAEQLDCFQAIEATKRAGGEIAYVPRNGESLKEVRFDAKPIGGDDFAAVCRLPNLRLFTTERLSVADVDLAPLKQASQLEVLQLNRAKLDKLDLACLATLKNLQVLVLKNATVPEDGFEHLAKLACLRELRLQGTGLTDAAFVHLAPLEQLEVLNLSRTNVTDAGFAALPLTKFSGLTDLTLSQIPIGDKTFAQIGQCAGLQRLTLIGTNLNDSSIRYLANLKQLTTLIIDITEITDAGLAHLAGLDNLELLDISYTNVSDVGLLSLGGLKKLKSLNVSLTRVTDDGLSEFARSLPDVVVKK